MAQPLSQFHRVAKLLRAFRGCRNGVVLLFAPLRFMRWLLVVPVLKERT